MPFDIWMEHECAELELGLKCPREEVEVVVVEAAAEEDEVQDHPDGEETTTIEADHDLLLGVDFREAEVALLQEADPELAVPDLIPENVDKNMKEKAMFGEELKSSRIL